MHYYWCYKNKKEFKGDTILCQDIRQPRSNGQIPRQTQTSKMETGRTHPKIWMDL